MAAMPGSGSISSANLNSVFGRDSSFSSEDYYRGGRIPSTELVIGAWGAYLYSPGVTEWVVDLSAGNFRIYLNGTLLVTNNNVDALEYIIDPYQYERGELESAASPFRFYSFRRRLYYYDNINTSVPFSGQITSSQWYGARTANN